MEEANNDLLTAKETLLNKINTIIEDIKNEVDNQFTNLINDILKDLKDINIGLTK